MTLPTSKVDPGVTSEMCLIVGRDSATLTGGAAVLPITSNHALCLKKNQTRLLKLLNDNDEQGYGVELAERVFNQRMIEAFSLTVDRAGSARLGVRLRLSILPEAQTELRGVWWETLFDPKRSRKLACAQDVAFSRYDSQVSTQALRPLDDKVRMLMLVSSPQGLGAGKWKDYQPLYDPGDDQRYKRRLDALLKKAGLENRIEWTIETRATYDQMQQHLTTRKYNIVHVVAHGTPQGLLLEDSKTHLPAGVPFNHLWNLISPLDSLRLVVLVSCNGLSEVAEETTAGPAPPGSPFLDLAEAMVKAGVPSVVAFRGRISIEAGELFASNFYQSLGRCGDWGSGVVDAAVNTARSCMNPPRLDDKWAWAKAVLFMGGEGKLFELPEEICVHSASPRRAGRSTGAAAATPPLSAAQNQLPPLEPVRIELDWMDPAQWKAKALGPPPPAPQAADQWKPAVPSITATFPGLDTAIRGGAVTGSPAPQRLESNLASTLKGMGSGLPAPSSIAGR